MNELEVFTFLTTVCRHQTEREREIEEKGKRKGEEREKNKEE